MNYGSPMNQAFLLEALRRYAKEVVENKEALREAMKNSMIHPDAWISSAESWLSLESSRK